MNPTDYKPDGLVDTISGISLEDIMKEFGSDEVPDTEVPPLETAEAQDSAIPDSTIRMDAVAPASVSHDTAVYTPVADAVQTEEAPQYAPRPPKPPKAEPFSEEWEPEYEEPMGEFTPKAHIPFPPKNRLRQLRQKLVAGPERRYQALAEVGLGQLQVGIFINFLLAFVSVAITVAQAMGLIDPARLRTIIFCQLLLAMLAALVGCYRLLEGLASLFRGHFSLETSLFVTFIACIADGLLCLNTQRLSCSCLFCLQIMMAQAAAYQRRNTEMGQMDVLRKASDLIAITKVPDFRNGHPGYVCTEGNPESFLEHYRKPSTPEKILSIYALLSLAAGTALAVAMYMLHDTNTAVQIFMASQLLALPVSAFVSMSRPTAILQNQLHHRSAVLCGWQGIRTAEKRTVFPLHYTDLFPHNAVKLNGVKFYGTVDPGRVVSYTTALLCTEESGLLTVFHQLPRSHNSVSHTVESFTQHSGGISGTINGSLVLVGTAACIQDSGVELPDSCKVAQAIYTAVDGQLSGVFAVTHNRAKASAAGLRILCGNRTLTPLLTACDFLLTPKFIRDKLDVNAKRLVLPDRGTRLALGNVQPEADDTVIALTTKDSLVAKVCAVIGAQTLKSALKAGAAIHILGGAIGLAAVAALALTGGIALLTPVNLLLYTAVWSIPGLLITEFTRFL